MGGPSAMETNSKSALILIEYQNDSLAPTGGINSQFQDRKQLEAAIVNSAKVLAEARRRNMEVIRVTMLLEPTYLMLGQGRWGSTCLTSLRQTDDSVKRSAGPAVGGARRAKIRPFPTDGFEENERSAQGRVGPHARRTDPERANA